MTNVVDWILDLFRDPVQAQAFINDPARSMQNAGVQNVTAAQVQAVAATVAPAAVIHGFVGLISVRATSAPLCDRISSHSLLPVAAAVPTTYALDVGTGVMCAGAVGVGATAGMTASGGTDGAYSVALGMTTETVLVRAVTAATPQPERTTSAAGMASAARFRVIETASVNLVD